MEREKFKDIPMVAGGEKRNFRVHKLPAKNSLVIIKLFSVLGPVIQEVFNSGIDFANLDKMKIDSTILQKLNIGALAKRLGEIDDDTYSYLQKHALNVCYEILPKNDMPVRIMNDNGSFGVPGLEDDMITVFALMIHSLWFNAQSFLAESPLSGLLGEI